MSDAGKEAEQVVTVIAKNIEGHFIQIHNQGGECFYCLADILDALDMKPHLIGGDIEKEPVRISARIIWGLRKVGECYIESPFIDEESAINMFKTAESQKN